MRSIPACKSARSGRRQDALRMVEQLERRAEHEYVSPAPRGFIWVALGEKERGYALLQKACAERAWLLWAVKIHPLLRFHALGPAVQVASEVPQPGVAPKMSGSGERTFLGSYLLFASEKRCQS
jgi:hypothetical protein